MGLKTFKVRRSVQLSKLKNLLEISKHGADDQIICFAFFTSARVDNGSDNDSEDDSDNGNDNDSDNDDVGHIQILFCILPQEEEKLSASRHDPVKGEIYEERTAGMLFLLKQIFTPLSSYRIIDKNNSLKVKIIIDKLL